MFVRLLTNYYTPRTLSSNTTRLTTKSLIIAPFVTILAAGMSSSSASSSTAQPALLKRATIIPAKSDHLHTIIWLHGLGDSSEGFSGLFRSLPMKHTRVVLPNAPVRPITVNGGIKMQGWYDIADLGKTEALVSKQDVNGIKESAKLLDELITFEAKTVGVGHVIVGGFSQGGAMTLYTCLHGEHALAGIISCSAYLLQHTTYPAHMSEVGKHIPVFAYHGTADGVVPYPAASKGYELLKSFGANIEFHTEKGLTHSMSDEGLQMLVRWVQQRFANNM